MQNSLPSDVVADERLRLIVDSYRRLTGRPLFASVPAQDDELRSLLWQAPFAIVAHGTEDDPVFFYGNRYALRCFELSFEEFARLPSRLSVEPLAREARAELMARVTQRGYVDGYSGTRIAKGGRRFMIRDCTIWNLVDEQGVRQGQAAVFTAPG